jgi:allophanate hydrolase
VTDSPWLEVVAAGALASIQDAGRRGHRRIGVPWSGVLDARLMRVANALAGNAEGTPVVECFDGGQHFVARGGAVRVAVAGHATLEIERHGERQAAAAWRSVRLAAGDTLRIRRLTSGRIAVLAIEGLAIEPVLGSASTYARAALGGLDGRPLAAGARLPAARALDRAEQGLRPPSPESGPIRVVLGPQADHFAPAAVRALLESDYRVTAEADRMGVRLEGPALAHAGSHDIVSDATAPGSIQVPGNGQPIVLLADAQTAGGYPKIATVVGADLARIAGARPGQTLRFTAVGVAEGERLAREADAQTRLLISTIRPLAGGTVDEAALYGANLVSGTVDALAPEWRPDAASPAPPPSAAPERTAP